MRSTVLVILCFLVHVNGLLASHIIGGGISYQCLQPNTYQIKLTIYRDCSEGVPWFDDPARIAVFDRSTDSLVTSIGDNGFISIPFSQSMELPVDAWTGCLNNRPEACIHYTQYIQSVELPSRSEGYILSYQRCCRNDEISNIWGQGAVNYSAIIEGEQQCNSSPEIQNHLVPYVCVGENIELKIDATDPDADSLSFFLSTPLTAQFEYPNISTVDPPPFDEVNWRDPFNHQNMLGGDSLRIDPRTGQLSGIPDQIGTFLIGLTIKEYREGEYIGELKFELEINVIICDRFVAEALIPDTVCDDSAIELVNLTEHGISYNWMIQSEDGRDTVLVGQNPVLYNLSPGTYQIEMVARNEHGCEDSIQKTMDVLASPGHIDFQVRRLACDDELKLRFLPSDTSSIIEDSFALNWYINDEMYSEISPEFSTGTDSIFVRMYLSKNGYCSHVVKKKFATHLMDEDLYYDRYDICNGDSVILELKQDPGSVDITWNPAQSLLADDVKSPIAFPGVNTDYTVLAVNEFGCQRQDTVQVRVHDSPPAFEIETTQNDISPGETVLLEAPANVHFTYHWSSSHPFAPMNSAILEVQPMESTLYILRIENEWGCQAKDSILIRVKQIECQPPEIFLPNAFSPNGDGVNDVLRLRGEYIDRIHLKIYDRWGQKVFESHSQDKVWRGKFKGENVPSGTYAYSLEVHCINGEQVFRDQGSLFLYR